MSPATIRSWIAKGTLRATRPGKRKLLVRRSELDRMLAGEDMWDPGGGPDQDDAWRSMDTVSPPSRSPHWPADAAQHVTPGGWLGLAETEWRTALRGSATAAPDNQFGVRLREIAEAAARKAAAFADITEPPGPWWQRQTTLQSGSLSYELRPGGNRPGPPGPWSRLDGTVEELATAMQSHSVPAEQSSLEKLSLLLNEIADALQDRNEYPWPTDWPEEPDEVLEEPDSGEASAA